MPLFFRNTLLHIFAVLWYFLAPLALADLLLLHSSFRDAWLGNMSQNKASVRNMFFEGQNQTFSTLRNVYISKVGA